MKSLHCVVSGKVQGGNFQGWVHEQAEELGLKGWVRNIADSRAEIILQGKAKQFEDFKRRLEEKAPVPSGKDIKIEVIDYDKEYSGFEIRG